MGRLRPSINRRPLYRGRRLNGAPAPLRLGSRHPRGQRIGSIRVEEPRQLFLTDTTDHSASLPDDASVAGCRALRRANPRSPLPMHFGESARLR